MSGERLRYDMADLTLRMQDEISELLGEPLDVAMQGPKRGRAMATVLYVLHRPNDPTFTIDNAYDMPQRDYEVVTGDDADTPKDNGGTEQPLSLASGG